MLPSASIPNDAVDPRYFPPSVSGILRPAASTAVGLSITIGLPHFSNVVCIPARSRRAWLVGSSPVPTTARRKYPRPVVERIDVSAAFSPTGRYFFSASIVPITLTSSSAFLIMSSTLVFLPSSTLNETILHRTFPLAILLPQTRRYEPASNVKGLLKCLADASAPSSVASPSSNSRRYLTPFSIRLMEKWR